MKKRMKRFLAIILSAAMVLSYTGVSFAEELISELVPAEAAENIEMAEAVEAEEAAEMAAEEAGAEAESAGPAEQWEENLTEKLLQKKDSLPEGDTVNLVSFGDSMTNGYGHDGYYEGGTQVNGFRQNDVTTTYPAYLKKYLEGAGKTVNWEALAISCMRTEDINFLLRYHTEEEAWNILAAELDNTGASVDAWNDTQKARWDATFVDDGNVVGDYFTWNEFVNARFGDWQETTGYEDKDGYEWNTNPTLAYAKYFQEATKNADVITLGTGNANFGVIMLHNITSLLTAGAFGSGFQDAVPVREVLQRRLPAEIVPQALEILDKVDAAVVPQLAVLGEEKAAKVLEIVEYTTVSFMFSYMDMLQAIDKLNDKDNLDVIMMGLMNTMDGVKIDLGDGQIFDIGVVVDAITDVLSAYYFVLPTALQEFKGDFENITFYMVPNEDHIEMQVAEMASLDSIKESDTIRERMIQEVSGMIFDLVRGPLNTALDGKGIQLPGWSMNDNTAHEYREKVEAYEQLQADYKAWVEGGHKGLFNIADTNDDGALKYGALFTGDTPTFNANDALACAVYLAFEQAIIANAENATLDLNGLMSLMGGTEGLAGMMGPIAGALNPDPSALTEKVSASVSANAKYIVTPKTTPNPVPPAQSEVTLLVDSSEANNDAARADGATYKTIQGALEKAQNGDTIKLNSDITTTAVVWFEGPAGTTKLIILDLNGKTLTSSYDESGRVAVEAQGNVDVTIQNGAIISTGTQATVYVKGGTHNSKLTLVDVTVENKLTGARYNVYLGNHSKPALVLKGATTLKGGSTLIWGNNTCVAVETGIYNFDPTFYVNTSNFEVTGPGQTQATQDTQLFTAIELTNALNGALGGALVSEDATSLGGLLSLYARMIIGNGIGSHPTGNGHRTLCDEILRVYPDVTAKEKIISDAQDAFAELQRILGELAAETGEFVDSYTMNSDEYKDLIVEIEKLQALLEGDRDALYADLTKKADEAKALAEGRLSELKSDLESQGEFLEGKGEEYWGRAVTLEEHTVAAVDDIEKAYNEAKIALEELCDAEAETYQTIIEKLPDAKKVVNVAVIPDMQDAVKAFAAMKNSSVRLAGKVKAAEAAVKNFENVTDEKTAGICKEVQDLHDDLAELHDEGVETFNQKMAQYAAELKEDGETIRGKIEDVHALLMEQAAGIEAQCEEIREIAKGLPEDIYQYAERYAEENGLIKKYGVPVGAAYFAVTEIRKLLEEYPDMPEKAWEYAEQTGLLDKLDQALNDLFEKYSEAVNEELNAMIEELKGELSGLEDCEFSKEEFEKKAEEVCGLLKEKYEYLQNELEKIKRLENCLKIASDYLLGEASQAAKELGNEIWQIVDAFEKGFNEAKQQTIAQLEAKLAEIRTELSQFQTELAGKICEEIRRTEAMIREMAEKGKAGVIEMSGMICDMMKKICSEIREVVYDATHTDYYMHKGNNYVALGGKTLNAYYLNCDDIAAQRYSRLVADALTEEYKKPVKDDVKTDLDLTVINGEAFVKKNAEKLAEADLITYQVDADVKTLVKILMGESKGDISDYVPADTLEIARRLEDVLEEILVSNWSDETQKKADEAKEKLVKAVNAYVLAIYDGSDPELIVNEEYLASVDRHIERVMDAMIAKMAETAGVLNAQKEAALAGVIENRALIRDYFEKAAYIAIAYAVETVKVSETMRAINPEAAILLVGMYNPLQGVTVKLGEDTINVGNLFDYIIMASNMYCTAYAAVSETVTYVAVPGTKIGMEPQTINVNDPAEIVKAIFGIVTDDKATYATVAGHENIKERIIDALNVIPYALTGIAVTAAPAKTSYVEGQSFDPTGMEITAAYSDGTSEVVSGWTVTDGEALTAGKQSVTISYTEDGVEATTTQAVTVVTKVPTALTVKTAPAKTAYVAGQAFDPTGMVVVATYNDGTSAETKSYVVIGGDALTEGQTSVTISYTSGETVTTTQAITVVAKVPTGITVKKAPAKTAYVAGENFDPTGMVVEAAYNDGTTAEITGYEVINGNALTAGQTSVTISYTVGSTTVTTTQAITVKAKYTPVYYGGGSVSYVLFTGTWNNPVTNGTWIQNANGVWHYGTTQQFRNTWAYIYNPYAGEGQNKNDWFWFDANGNMLTGWQFINGKWYYLNPTMDGTLGACLLGPGKTPDGWEIDASGAWTGR